jgi:hypothetical protein
MAFYREELTIVGFSPLLFRRRVCRSSRPVKSWSWCARTTTAWRLLNAATARSSAAASERWLASLVSRAVPLCAETRCFGANPALY